MAEFRPLPGPDDRAGAAPPIPSTARRPAEWAALAALALALSVYAWFMSFAVPKSSDQANLLLAGIDMLHGNWRLQDWSMVADSYWTLDVAFGAVLSGLRWLAGRPLISSSTLILQPALTWAALCMAAILVAQRSLETTRRRFAAAAIVVAIIGVPILRNRAAGFAMLSGIHLLSILAALAAFALAGRILHGSSWRSAAAFYAAVLILATCGDPLLLLICVLPVLAGLPFASTHVVHATSRRAVLAAATIVSPIVATILIKLNSAIGGFSVASLPLDFAPFDELPTNVAVTLHGLLSVFSADFTGHSIADALPELMHAPLLLLAAAAVILILAGLLRKNWHAALGQQDLVTLCLAIGAAADLASLVFSRRIGYEGGALATGRYLFPAWIFAGTLLARLAAGTIAVPALSLAAIAAAVFANAPTIAESGYPAVNAAEYELLAALQSQPDRSGISGYWEAGLIEVASHGTIKLFACVPGPDGHLVAFRNANKAFDLAAITAHDFFVILRKPAFQLSADDITRNYGPPARVQQLSGFTLLFYRASPVPKT